MIYYTSDHHFGHENIIKYCNRYTYCQTADEMNKILVDKWNEVIKPEDTVWHLGDVYFKDGWSVLEKLNGIKFLILGNHDQKHKELLKQFFIIKQEDIVVDNQNKVVLSHYPLKEWTQKYHGYIHLHGHSHGNVEGYDKDAIDVGVDCWNGYPVTINQIKAKMANRYFK